MNARWEESTRTIRMVPENVCLAVRDASGLWMLYDDHYAKAKWGRVAKCIAADPKQTPDQLIKRLGKRGIL